MAGTPVTDPGDGTCTAPEGCDKPADALGLCGMHCQRQRKHGTLESAVIPDLPGENWHPVLGCEGLYAASNHGRIKSLARITSDGKQLRERLLPGSPDKLGRLDVRLHYPDGPKTRRIHQLIMEAFAGLPEPGMEVRHLDGNPANNRWAPGSTDEEVRTAGGNLIYGTHAQNMADMIEHGTTNRRFTHCPQGHEYTEENTIIYASGSRGCLECKRERGREWARANYVPTNPMIPCAHCGTIFERPFEEKNRKYCTDDCRKAAERERAKKRRKAA
jgi:hypothetical protein